MEDDEEVQYEVTDNNGCATDTSIFDNWSYEPESKVLMARFNAFKFPSSNNLRFQCSIRVCFGSCPPVHCQGVDAFGRRRRRRRQVNGVAGGSDLNPGSIGFQVSVCCIDYRCTYLLFIATIRQRSSNCTTTVIWYYDRYEFVHFYFIFLL